MKPQLLDGPESRKIGRCHDVLGALDFFNHEKIVGPGVGITPNASVAGIIPYFLGLHLWHRTRPRRGFGAYLKWNGLAGEGKRRDNLCHLLLREAMPRIAGQNDFL